ncbi:MAG: Crp/Fnr family transcriptional regulator [Acidobacteriota bacterium]
MKPLLQKISPDLAETLAKRGKKRTFAAGETLFDEGEKAHALPIVLSGKVKMTHFLESGKEVIIGMFEAGEFFAVPPVVDGKNYPASAVAMDDSELLLIKRKDFLDLLHESSEFSLAIIAWLCEMLRDKTATIQNLSSASPEHRVGTVLLKLAEREAGDGPVRIVVRREDIAKMAGLTTETTIRVVRKLADKKFIRIDHGKIILDDVEPLRAHVAD